MFVVNYIYLFVLHRISNLKLEKEKKEYFYFIIFYYKNEN